MGYRSPWEIMDEPRRWEGRKVAHRMDSGDI